MIRYPNNLKIGDTIGITAPSMGANIEKIDKALNNIHSLGYKTCETESVRKGNKLVSADAYTRFKEFTNLWEDENVKYILAARGGDFLMEMIPFLDEYFKDENKLKNIKWIQGYSDISALNFYLTTKYNIATIQASNLSDYAMNPLHESLLKPFEFVKEDKALEQKNYDMWQLEEDKENPNYTYNLTQKSKFKILNKEYIDKEVEFSGRLIGGCLDVISMYVNTKWDNVCNFIQQFEKEGIIWHIENCELTSPEIYRRLWLMKQAGWFKYSKGIILGRTFSGQTIEDFTYIDAIEKTFLDLNIPIIYDLDFGHQMPQWTMINGSYATFKYNIDKCSIIQERK